MKEEVQVQVHEVQEVQVVVVVMPPHHTGRQYTGPLPLSHLAEARHFNQGVRCSTDATPSQM